ncbi:hypothetical protein D3C87_1749890 [compost metagenome]
MPQIKNVAWLADAFINQTLGPLLEQIQWSRQQIWVQIALDRKTAADAASAFSKTYAPVQTDDIRLEILQAWQQLS